MYEQAFEIVILVWDSNLGMLFLLLLSQFFYLSFNRETLEY